jgi:hypothetical protein
MFFKFMNGRDMNSYFLALEPGRIAPKLPPGGVLDATELRALNKVKAVAVEVDSAMTPDVYSYSRNTIRRNLYRIPIP